METVSLSSAVGAAVVALALGVGLREVARSLRRRTERSASIFKSGQGERYTQAALFTTNDPVFEIERATPSGETSVVPLRPDDLTSIRSFLDQTTARPLGREKMHAGAQ